MPKRSSRKVRSKCAYTLLQICKAWVVIGALAFSVAPVLAEQIPNAAYKYKRELTREAQRTWGLNAPTARFAGQIAVESGWSATAKSRYAVGLAQFTPDTAKWIAEVYPKEFNGLVAPYSPAWALRALVVYDKHLYARVKGYTECDRWQFVLRAYNGGLGHVTAEARNAADPLSAASVAEACGTARRSVKHCPENLGYPRRILWRWEPMYADAGWGGKAVCAS